MKADGQEKTAERAVALAHTGRVAEGLALLERAIREGDALSAATLAEWRLTGDFVRRDLRQARDLFARAAALGLSDAEPIHIALLANGAGGTERRWNDALTLLRARSSRDAGARRQLAVLDRMMVDERGDPRLPPRRELLSSSPPIDRLPDFLTQLECRYLIDRAEPLLQPSSVVHPVSGTLVRNPLRTSTAALFPFVLEDPALHAINRRIAAATGTSYEQGEPLQVLSYAPGEEYKLHSDALPPGGNQRIMTLLVYLNADFDGGETAFPSIGLAHRGVPGDGIVFSNVDHAGRPRADARHAGLPVRRGRKLLLSKWIRASPLDLSGPPDRPF